LRTYEAKKRFQAFAFHKCNLYHYTPARGEILKTLLSSTPTKSLLHPIHAVPRAAPASAPAGNGKTVGGGGHGGKSPGKSPGGSGKKEKKSPGGGGGGGKSPGKSPKGSTMTPGRCRAKASDFF
jgi:hypothetical protein